MHALVASRREALSEVCRRFGVRRLEVFGSAAAGGFDPERSDVDLIIDIGKSGADPLEEYFGLKTELEAVLKRPVDLLVEGSVRNPFVLASIDASRELIFVA